MKTFTGRKPKRGGWQTLAFMPHRGSEKPILVAFTPYNIVLRIKGTRQELHYPIAKVYIHAATAYAADQAKQKREAREQRRKERAGYKPRKPRKIRARTVRRGAFALKG